MRRLWPIAGVLVISCLLAGCGGRDVGESTATPDNLQDASDAAKKLRQREAAAKGRSPAAPPPKAGGRR